MLSTLSALLYFPANEKIYSINIGDSRIFGYNANGWNQLTTDDTTRIPYKENGKLKLQNGVPIYMTGLNKAMGGDKKLSVEMVEINANEYTGFTLLTDGFYSISNWEKYVNELFHTPSTKQLIEKFNAELLGIINDDASLSMLRLPIPHTFQFSIDNNSNSQYSNTMLQPFIYQELDNAFVANDIPKINKIVKWMDKFQILDTKPNMILLLERLIKFQVSEAIQIATGIIRKI